MSESFYSKNFKQTSLNQRKKVLSLSTSVLTTGELILHT